MELSIECCDCVDQPGWLALRAALWPDTPAAEHLDEMTAFLSNPSRFLQLVARAPGGQPVGLAEASVRHDYVNGTEASPVAFLEGLFVVAEQRRQGIAARLVREVAAWAQAQGIAELASDALLENRTSHAVHRALGFQESERVVFFRKALP